MMLFNWIITKTNFNILTFSNFKEWQKHILNLINYNIYTISLFMHYDGVLTQQLIKYS